jgi:hypothetical protein
MTPAKKTKKKKKGWSNEAQHPKRNSKCLNLYL